MSQNLDFVLINQLGQDNSDDSDIIGADGTFDREADPPIGLAALIKALRKVGQPICLYGEYPMERYIRFEKRFKILEI